ncbi:MAG: hypothetical protein HY811_04665 [Planctomycetes bacterium]|nr:hypothetical protein [Planctomycetota bacterium]
MQKLIKLVIYLAVLVSTSTPLFAHDITDKDIMGIGDYIEIRFWPYSDTVKAMVTVDYWILYGDIESVPCRTAMDTNNDGVLSMDEQAAFMADLTKRVVDEKFIVEVDGKPVSFTLYSDFVKCDLSGSDKVDANRIKLNFPFAHFIENPDNEWHRISITLRNILRKQVTFKLYVVSQDGTEVKYMPDEEANMKMLRQGFGVITDEKTNLTLSFRLLPGFGGSPDPLGGFFGSAQGPAQAEDKTKEMMLKFLGEAQLNFIVILVALLISFFYGAAHALAPGHGKTLVAAYLIGSKGTIWDAIFLGLTVTLTHVSVVIIAGVLFLILAQSISYTALSGIFGIVSSALIVIIGIWMFISRLLKFPDMPSSAVPKLRSGEGQHGHSHLRHPHEHSHNGHTHDASGVHIHEHSHNHPTKITLGTLLPLGISGGMLPCPAAIVVLLMAIKINRIAWGLAIILAFSLGLASVLITIGILLVSGSRILGRFSSAPKIIRVLAVIGPLIIVGIGLVLVYSSLKEINWL